MEELVTLSHNVDKEMCDCGFGGAGGNTSEANCATSGPDDVCVTIAGCEH